MEVAEWPWGITPPGGVGRGVSPRPQPQTGRASFPSIRLSRCFSTAGNAAVLGHMPPRSIAAGASDPSDSGLVPRSDLQGRAECLILCASDVAATVPTVSSEQLPHSSRTLSINKTRPSLRTKHPAALRHVVGFPNLGLLRRLRHPSASSVKPASTIVDLVA